MFGCLVVLGVLFGPRLLLLLLHWTQGFMDPISTLWAVLGWLFMPYTTLWCCYVYGHGGEFNGWHLVILVIAVLSDLGVGGGSASTSQRERRAC